MLLILIALVCAATVSVGLLTYANEHFFNGGGFPAALIGTLLAIVTGVTSIVYVYAGWEWLASQHRTAIINREYNTNYTREEIFFASDVIDTIRQLDRKRVEINGNIMRGPADSGEAER